jgi:hypothetical protein
VQKEYDSNNEKMAEYLAEVWRIEMFFNGFKARCVPWLDNCDDDHLAWIASSRAPTPLDIIIEKLSKPLVRQAESTNEMIWQDMMATDELEQDPMYYWMHLIKMFLENQPPSDGNSKVERIVHKSK